MQASKGPLISVIIDNYNYERFLPDAINSVLQQAFTDYELIVVDDASTDHSDAVILSYGERLTPILLPKNVGQGGAFSAGFAASRGELICFLDADDVFLPNKLALVAEAAAKNKEAILFYHQGFTVDKNLQKKGAAFPQEMPQGNLRKKILLTAESVLPPTSFLTFRRSYLEKIFPLDPFMTRIDADSPMQVIAALIGEVVAIPHPLTYYRVHGDNWFSNDDFKKYDLDTLRHLARRTEKVFHYINIKLAKLGVDYRLDLYRHLHHRRNLFIFKHLSWWEFISYAIFNLNFKGLAARWDYIKFGISKRKQNKILAEG